MISIAVFKSCTHGFDSRVFGERTRDFAATIAFIDSESLFQHYKFSRSQNYCLIIKEHFKLSIASAICLNPHFN